MRSDCAGSISFANSAPDDSFSGGMPAKIWPTWSPHAMASLGLNAFRRSGGTLPEPIADQGAALLDEDADDVHEHHERVSAATAAIARTLAEQARSGALTIDALPTVGSRLGSILLAGAMEVARRVW